MSPRKEDGAGRWYGPAARERYRWAGSLNWYGARAGEQAMALGVDHIGTEHVLLALVAPGMTSKAAAAMRAAGATHEKLTAAARERQGKVKRMRPSRQGNTFTPSWYQMTGAARGFAAAQGASAIAAEHILLALLYEPTGAHGAIIYGAGTSPRRIRTKLAALGVDVPAQQPPRPDDTRWGDEVAIRVPGSDAWALASRVAKLKPEYAPLRFHFNATTVWFTSGEGVDLHSIVRKARRQQLALQRRER
jgi:hypothetical protein